MAKIKFQMFLVRVRHLYRTVYLSNFPSLQAILKFIFIQILIKSINFNTHDLKERKYYNYTLLDFLSDKCVLTLTLLI